VRVTELPRIEDLPRAPEGYDPARVEQAFETFAERLRSLEAKVDALAPSLRAPAFEREPEEWPLEPASVTAPAPDWVGSVPPPLARALVVPRLALEAGFVLAVPLLAGLADLGAGWIVGVTALAWAIVALLEWSAAAKRARWRLEEVPAPAGQVATGLDETDPWALPPLEATAIDVPEASESHTIVARLPAPEPEPEAAAAEQPSRRRFRRG
jgi:hypothetical protein